MTPADPEIALLVQRALRVATPTLGDFAKRLGVTYDAVRKWSTARSTPRADSIAGLAALLDEQADVLRGIARELRQGDRWGASSRKPGVIGDIMHNIARRHLPNLPLYNTVATVFAEFVDDMPDDLLEALERSGWRVARDGVGPTIEGFEAFPASAVQRLGGEYDRARLSEEERVKLALLGLWQIANVERGGTD
jgi:hypothetical protein